MKYSIPKSLFTISLSLFCILINAQPLLVGHRGSYWGVENTSEAFINGALKGYDFLECDINNFSFQCFFRLYKDPPWWAIPIRLHTHC